MVSTTVLVVAFAHVRRKRNLILYINVTSKTGFALTFGASSLTARMVFFQMKSVLIHVSESFEA
jgi:hypothetical protein